MYNQRYEEIGKPEIIRRIDIFDYVRAFIRELEKLEGKTRIKLNSEFDTERIKGLMNIPKNTTFKSLTDMRSGQAFWKYQEVDYVRSNLGSGKGALFYFICSRCDRRVKYLYFYTELEPPLCRQCCQLPYRSASYKERKVATENKFLTMGTRKIC